MPISVAVIGTYALLGAPVWALLGATVLARAVGAAIGGQRRLEPHRLIRTAAAAERR